jgi:hypothetical protein
VTRVVLGWLGGAFLATIALLVVRRVLPAHRELELDVYALVLGALALLGLVSWLRRDTPRGESLLQRALERHEEQVETPPELARMERVVVMSAAQEFDLHYRLRPVLREIALARLAERGLQLDGGSPAVREQLGPELWEVVRPERPAPENRHQRGVGLARIERLVARLEGSR